jgi:hypothetical protein
MRSTGRKEPRAVEAEGDGGWGGAVRRDTPQFPSRSPSQQRQNIFLEMMGDRYPYGEGNDVGGDHIRGQIQRWAADGIPMDG